MLVLLDVIAAGKLYCCHCSKTAVEEIPDKSPHMTHRDISPAVGVFDHDTLPVILAIYTLPEDIPTLGVYVSRIPEPVNDSTGFAKVLVKSEKED